MPNNKIRVNKLSKDTDQSTDGDANTVNWEGDIHGSPNITINQIQGLDEESARALIHNILGEYGITKENPLHRPEELSTEAIKRAEELLEAAKKVEMDAVEYFMLGQLAMSAGNHSEAESNFGLAENKFIAIGNDRWRALASYHVGVSLSLQMKFVDSFDRHKQARKELQKIGDNEMESYVFADMGNLRMEMGKIGDAKKIYSKIVKQKGYPISLHKAWSGLGVIAQKEGQLTEAVKCHNEAMTFAMMIMDSDRGLALQLLSTGHANLAWIHQALGEKEQALEQLQSGLNCASEIGDVQTAAYAMLNLADMLFDFEEFEEVEELLKSAHEMLQDTEFSRGKIRVLLGMSALYRSPFSGKYDTEKFENALMAAQELIAGTDYTPETHCLLNIELAAYNSTRGKGDLGMVPDLYWKSIEQAIEAGDGNLVMRAVESAKEFFERTGDVESVIRADQMGMGFLQTLIRTR